MKRIRKIIYCLLFIILSEMNIQSSDLKTEKDFVSEIERVIQLYRKNPSKQTLENMYQTALSTFQTFPDSPIIVSKYVYVEPKNQRAFMLKRMLEAQEEFKHRQ